MPPILSRLTTPPTEASLDQQDAGSVQADVGPYKRCLQGGDNANGVATVRPKVDMAFIHRPHTTRMWGVQHPRAPSQSPLVRTLARFLPGDYHP